MLERAIESYIALRRAAGFKFRTQADILRSFQRYATANGDTHVRAETTISWATKTGSVHHRASRLDIVRGFAAFARAEDSGHTTAEALETYQKQRHLFFPSTHGPLLVGNEGEAIPGSYAAVVFRSLIERVGLHTLRGGQSPRLIDLRHT